MHFYTNLKIYNDNGITSAIIKNNGTVFVYKLALAANSRDIERARPIESPCAALLCSGDTSK